MPYKYGNYVGVCPGCGAVRGAHVDDPGDRKLTASFVAKMIRYGLRVNWWPPERAMEWGECTCAKAAAPQPTLL